MTYRIVGSTTVDWDDTRPFIFTMSEAIGPAEDRRKKVISIDISDLRQGFEDQFLLHLKDHLMQRRCKVTLISIETESKNLRSLFRKIIQLKLFDLKVSVVDESFLLALGAVKEFDSNFGMRHLMRAFVTLPHGPMFAPGLHKGDFPIVENNKGRHGRQIDRILAKALTRAACVHILSRCEQAYDMGEIDIGHFAFSNLAFAVFCRPESYRQIRLDDLDFDKESKSSFIHIIPAKTRLHQPRKIRYQLSEFLGVLLQKQRQQVVVSCAHLVASEDIGKLALFPARRMKANNSSWVSRYANENFGMCESSSIFGNCYPKAIQRLLQDARITLSANILRHTVGTQLALSGASAQTIQAVLKHASNQTCSAYVDIAFHGLFNQLNKAMHPAFQSHLPAINRFNSKNDPIPFDKAIRTDNLETGHTELTGECGKQIQCEHAPIICYGCQRFIPCWDADHSMNLSTVQREIDDFKHRGKPFQHMVQKWQEAKYRIIFVMNAAALYRHDAALETRA